MHAVVLGRAAPRGAVRKRGNAKRRRSRPFPSIARVEPWPSWWHWSALVRMGAPATAGGARRRAGIGKSLPAAKPWRTCADTEQISAQLRGVRGVELRHATCLVFSSDVADLDLNGGGEQNPRLVFCSMAEVSC